MRGKTVRALVWLGSLLALALPGCGKPPRPPVVPVEGVLLLNGQPLPQARIEFVPDLEHYGAEMNSTGLTDDQGRFTLTCAYQGQPGAAVAKHRVLVTNPPTPEGARGQDEKSQAVYAQFQAKLKNRPIPPAYSNVARPPCVGEVKADRNSYGLKLTRYLPPRTREPPASAQPALAGGSRPLGAVFRPRRPGGPPVTPRPAGLPAPAAAAGAPATPA